MPKHSTRMWAATTTLLGFQMKHQCIRDVYFTMQQQGHSLKVIAAALSVTRQTLWRWQKEGPQRPPRARHRPCRRKLNATVSASLFQYFTEHNTTTLRQASAWLVDRHTVTVTIRTVLNYCRRYQLTHKKGSKAFSEMSEVRAQQFLQDIAANFGPHVIALDEAAFFFNHVRGYAWSVRGTKAIIPRPGIRGKAHSLLLSISTAGVVQWKLYEGAVDAVRFSEFLTELPSHSTLVLDNARIHHASNVLLKKRLPTVATIASQKDITLSYLPPYAPQLNPVELCFNMIRTRITRQAPRDAEELALCIDAAVKTLNPLICQRTMNKVFKLF